MKRTIIVCALVIAVAVAGTAGAARMITGGQIKNGSIGLADLSSGARAALRGQRGAQGQAGPMGPSGPAGPAGPAGGLSATFTVDGPEIPTDPGAAVTAVRSSRADCPAGSLVVGGGFRGGVRTFIADAVVSGNGYFVIGVNNGLLPDSIRAQAVCARGAGAAAAAVRKPSLDVEARLADLRRQWAEDRKSDV